MERQAVLLLGRQGAGKGTVGAFLTQELNAIHLSAGELLRRQVAAGGPLGQEISDQIDRGLPVPVATSYGLLGEHLRAATGHELLVLDGFPHEVSELDRLRELLGREPQLAIFLEVPTPIAVARLLARETCEDCGANYGPGCPSRSPGACDQCGAPLAHRADDSPEGLGRRLDGWARRSPEILAYFEQAESLIEIDASRPSPEVNREVLEVVRDHAISDS
jgi:adenylate kinase